MFQVTTSGSTLPELRANVAELLASLGSDDGPATERSPAPKPAPKATAPKPAPKPKEPETLDYESEVRPLVIKVSKDLGRDACLEILAKYTNPATDEPCTKGQEVDPADYEQLVADCTAALETAA